jgi:DNA-binding NtrC family response regulator
MVNHSNIRVLVVDDEPAIRKSLVSFLEDYDFQVFSAKSSEQALKILSSVPCQVAIVDLRLPGINGDTMILNAKDLYPSLRFLIHTGSVNFQLSADLTAVGILQEHLIVKPQYDLSVFIKAIERLVEEERG